MERAEPTICAIAASTVSQLRSGIFCLAISSICFVVTLPTICVPTVLAPDSTPAAFFRK